MGTAPLSSGSQEPARAEVISGACLMIMREVFESIGRFSEDYFMYSEDLDLCYRVARAGYVNYYVGSASVIHYGGGSSSPGPATVMKWQSMLTYFGNNHGRLRAWMFRLAMAVTAIARLAAIGASSAFRSVPLDGERRYSSAAKWRIVLKTLLTKSGPGRTRPLTEVRSAGG